MKWFCLKLPFTFDVDRLLADVAQFPAQTWVWHFNSSYFEGEWSGLALRSVGGDPARLYPDPAKTAEYRDTPLLARCPAVRQVLETLACPTTSVRFLKVTPGSRIREHKDFDLGFAAGEVRLHIPITTNPEVHFWVNGRRIPLRPGQCWYMDFSRPHRIENAGTTDRIHLVVDCMVNDWLRDLFQQTAATTTEFDLFGSISNGGFAEFCSFASGNPAVVRELRDTPDKPAFFSTAVGLGESHGFHFTSDDMQTTIEAERRRWLRLEQHLTPEAGLLQRQQPDCEARLHHHSDFTGWLPIQVSWNEAQPLVDWCWFDRERLTESFFHESIERRLRHPFNLLFRRQTTLEVLGKQAERSPGLAPRGFIFHMSRCGSTLIGQMLASSPRNLVLSEPGPVDDVLRAAFKRPEVTDEARLRWLKWVVSVLGQNRMGVAERLFIKFDCWHIFDLPLIRRAFPDVPWIFVVRDPVEVLVSHQGRRGLHMLPGVLEPQLFGLEPETVSTMPFEEYGARVLGSICEAAATACASEGGRVVRYEDLPELVWTQLGAVFGVSFAADEVAMMQQAAELDAKNPYMFFTPDRETKQTAATEAIRAAVETWVRKPYEKLLQ